MNTYSETLDEVANKLHDNFNKANFNKIAKVNTFIYYIDILEQISEALVESDVKDVLYEAQSDALNSMIFCFMGYYRQANICLRSSVELILSYIYYYDNNYDFILWKNDHKDMTWGQLTSIDKGVFNEKFLSVLYGQPVKTEKLLDKTKELYHITSQYVHGKYDYMQKKLTDGIEYSESLIDTFFIVSEKIIKIEIAILFLRFKKVINGKIDTDIITELEQLLKEYEVI